MDQNDEHSNGFPLTEEQQVKIDEIRKLLGPLPERLSIYCSDECIKRYLVARNWNIKKAHKMIKASLSWRLHYKPEEICWEDVAKEAETGKLYRTSLKDKYGRSILVMRPGYQNTKSVSGQIKFLVYCMENAIMSLGPGQSKMVWWIDYERSKLSDVSFKVSKETTHILQEHYPERLGVAVLFNPPKYFESFWKLVRPLLDPKTKEKIKFVYSDDPTSTDIIQDLLGIDNIKSFDELSTRIAFDYSEYSRMMREDDIKTSAFWKTKQINGSVIPDEII